MYLSTLYCEEIIKTVSWLLK